MTVEILTEHLCSGTIQYPQVGVKYFSMITIESTYIIALGFSTNSTTWLPVNIFYSILNLQQQKNSDRSNYHHYIELTNLRKEDTIIDGDIRMKSLSRNLFAFTRLATYNVLYLLLFMLFLENFRVALRISLLWIWTYQPYQLIWVKFSWTYPIH